MALRSGLRIKGKRSEATDDEQEPVTRRQAAADHRFRLQVDRQTKSSYPTAEEAEAAGLVIKQGYPIVQVVVHDAEGGTRKSIELPSE